MQNSPKVSSKQFRLSVFLNECKLIGEYTSYKTAHSYFEDADKIP